MKIKRIIQITGLVVFLAILFPTYILVNRVKNDYPLREYIKVTFLGQIKGDFKSYFTSDNVEELNLTTLHIEISDSSLLNLETQINERINRISHGEVSLVGNSKWEYVKAKAHCNSDTFKIDLRIRGDMPSNYNKSIDKSTFRFNIKKGKALKGKRKLSIIRTELESGYYGYLFYKCFKDQGFLANHIELIRLYFNGEYVGLRFLQEGFSKELIESSERREGPILRFKNDCVDSEGRYNEHILPELVAYKEKKILKKPALSKVYSRALNKYNEFVVGNIDISKCFNIDEYAKFYALSDVFLSHHANKCQNVKLYFNPINDKFEPIAWDPNCYERYEVKLPILPGHTKRFGELCNDPNQYPLHYLLSQNADFLEKYNYYLHDYLRNETVLKMINEYAHIIEKTESELFRQNFQQHFEINKFKNNIKNIRMDFKQKQHLYGNYYTKNQNLVIRSMCNLPIVIDSIKYKDVTIKYHIIIPPNNSIEEKISFKSIKSGKRKLIIYSSILGLDKVSKYKAKVFHEKDNFSGVFFNEYFNNEYFEIDSVLKTFRLKNKSLTLVENLYIPETGMKWIIDANTKILLDNANIICESAINATGTKDAPIIFSTKSTGGVFIKNTQDRSTLKHVQFKGLSAPLESNWSLTGAVTFYKSDVIIDSCLFENNKSEDGLNIVKSKFELLNSNFENCFSDALDIDFGNGLIKNIQVHLCKNDALDFSGSEIEINMAKLTNVGDKALSAGERTSINVENINIKNAFIAIASKDASLIKANKIKVFDSKFHFVSYMKKPEYGAAKIIATNSENDLKSLLIEEGCSLSLNGELFNGDKKDIYDNLYVD